MISREEITKPTSARRVPSKISPVDLEVLRALRGHEMMAGVEIMAVSKAGLYRTYTSLLKLAHMGLVSEIGSDEDPHAHMMRTYYRLSTLGHDLAGMAPPRRRVRWALVAAGLALGAVGFAGATAVLYISGWLFGW